MSEIYTSSQIADKLGISPNTIRVWKSRKSEQLVEGQHWFSQDGQTLWTSIGLQALTEIKNTINVRTSETGSSETGETTGVSETVSPVSDRYSQLIETVADALTPTLMKRLDDAVLGNLKRSIAQPMTPDECVSVLADLGLKPADPIALLGGGVAGLLQGETPTE